MKRYSFLLLPLFFLVMGCDRFLEIKSDAKLVVPRSLEDAQALLDDEPWMNEQRVPSRGEDAGDEYYFSEATYNSRPEAVRKFYLWEYPEYFGTGNDWTSAYVPIYNANLALEILENVERTDRNRMDWDNVKGSALFYRAFYFFKLLVVFSPVYDESTADTDYGIALRMDTDFNNLSTRASVRECYEQILKDLSEASEYLPDYSRRLTRPSKGAVYALLSNIHHYMGNYESSLEYANTALSYNSGLIDLNGDPDLLNASAASTPFVKFNKETIFYAELANNFVFVNRNVSLVDSALYDSFENHDLRKTILFRIVNGDALFKGTLTGANARKFGGLSTGEIILNKAESLAKLNQPQEAVLTLNTLLTKRYLTGSALLNPEEYDQQTALNVVRQERRKELMMRGVRFSDLKRYNKEGANIRVIRRIGGKEYILEPNSGKYNLPLPQDIIELTGMPQN